MSEIVDRLRGRKAVLCASTGGHLQQLYKLASAIGFHPESLWITFENSQSRSLLSGKRVQYLPYIASRDLKTTIKAVPEVLRILQREDFEVAISTGAAVAGAVLPVARILGKDAVYIESFARFDGPSITGKALGFVPGVRRYTQHRKWADARRWTYDISVLQGCAALPNGTEEVRSVFVTLGTISPYRFDRLVDRVLEIVPNDVNIIWQLGETDRQDLRGEIHKYITVDEFDRFVSAADVTITHAGVGSALRILDQGKFPLLVPRRRCHGEHVDDHQGQISWSLSEHGVATAIEADEIAFADLVYAASRKVEVAP
ncbi:glycosyltransferase [Rhodococcus hoagii]|nr:glycosyltransferase [Prescottella equi]